MKCLPIYLCLLTGIVLVTCFTSLQLFSPITAYVHQASTYSYFVIKEKAGFMLARAPRGSQGQPLTTPRPLMLLGNDFGHSPSDRVTTISLSPDSHYLAINGSSDHGELVWIYQTGTQKLALMPAGVSGNFLRWLPGGHTFLYRPMLPRDPQQAPIENGWQPGLWLIDAASGQYRNLELGAPSTDLIDAAPSPDGKLLVYSLSTGLGQGSTTYRMNLDGSGRARLFTLSASEGAQSIASAFAWSPDGARIAYERMSDSPTPFLMSGLWMMNTQGEQQVRLADADGGHGFGVSWSPDSRKIAFITRSNPEEPRADFQPQALAAAISVADVQLQRAWKLVSVKQTGLQWNIDPLWMESGKKITFRALNPANLDLGGSPGFWSVNVPGSGEVAPKPANPVRLSAPLEHIAATVSPFLHRPYYGDRAISNRTVSFFDHDKPWYVNDGIFVRYDGKRWNGVSSCQAGVNCYDGHNGYDLDLRFEPVLSAAAGTVIRAGWYNPADHNASFGLWVAIDHDNGMVTAYGHLSAILVTVGDKVKTQWQIGTSGTTGSSTGPHLHMSVYYVPRWQPTDPFGWSRESGNPNTVLDSYIWVSNPKAPTSSPNLGGSGRVPYREAIVVDENSPDCQFTGLWQRSDSPGDYAGSLRWTTVTSGPPTASATWTKRLPAAGYYTVGVYVDDNHAGSSWAPYTIISADPEEPSKTVQHVVHVDMSHIGIFAGAFGGQNTGPLWVSLGSYYFTPEMPARVVLNNSTGGNLAQLGADAVEFVKFG
jgi:murein DD-endopeptidase MepM/ murein hydrolase activator NlpD/Tol biopolymer transport system component